MGTLMAPLMVGLMGNATAVLTVVPLGHLLADLSDTQMAPNSAGPTALNWGSSLALLTDELTVQLSDSPRVVPKAH